MSENNEHLLIADKQPVAPGTRSVNKMPLVLGCSALLAFFLMMGWIAYNRANAPQGEDATPKMGNSRMFAEEIAGSHAGGLIPPDMPAEEKKVEPLSTPQLSIPLASTGAPNLDAPPLPPGSLEKSPYDEDLMRIRGAKFQMFEQGLQSKTGVQTAELRDRPKSSAPSYGSSNREEMLAKINETRQQVSSMSSEDPTKAYKARLEMLRNAGVVPAVSASNAGANSPTFAGGGVASDGGRNNLSSFDSKGKGEDRWLLDNPDVSTPRTPYELRAGFVIPATMISGINSDLPGQVIAQVSQDVFDSASGRHLVIPQGTRLVGAYNSDVAYGQERVMMAWQRLIFPDGKALDLGAMPGADGAGYSGFTDQIDNHYVRTFVSAFLMSGVIAGVSLSQDRGGNQDGNNQRASDALSEALGQTLGSAMAQMLMKNLNIAPTLEIRPGYRFNIMVTKDIPFTHPYKSFDY